MTETTPGDGGHPDLAAVERWADLIAPHDAYHVNEDGWTVCICGYVAEGDDDDGSHARHVAAALAPVVAAAVEAARTEALDEVERRIVHAIDTLDPRGSLFHVRTVRDRAEDEPVDPYCPEHGDQPTTYDSCSCEERARVTRTRVVSVPYCPCGLPIGARAPEDCDRLDCTDRAEAER